MKHAYLIIAHQEFDVLQKLIFALDADDNDIFIHIDKKVGAIPSFVLPAKSNLYFIEDRLSVFWGGYSQIEAEYKLFETAHSHHTIYSRYHLISGTHLPLLSSIDMHRFFDGNRDKEFLMFMKFDQDEKKFKIGKYHFFWESCNSKNVIVRSVSRFGWHFVKWGQYKFGLGKDVSDLTCKASNWVSLTGQAVSYLIENKKKVRSVFRWSFCGDEYFVPYLLMNSIFANQVVDFKHLVFVDFEEGGSPRLLTFNDLRFLFHSKFLFARKFSSNDMGLIDMVLDRVK